MNQFTDRYKKLNNSDLLKIIDNPADYQPEAIDAANDELTARRLTNEELLSAREENETRAEAQQLKSAKIKAFENKAKDVLYDVADTLNPIQSEKPSAPKAILWISILMILLFLYQLYSQFGLLKYMFTYGSSKWDLSMAMYFLRPLVLMPVAAVLFVLRRKSGWVLLSGFFTYLGLNTIALLYFEFRHPREPDNTIDHLFPSAPANSLIGWVIFIAGCLYFIYKKEVREIYNISTKNILVAAGIGVLLLLSSMIR